MPLSPEAIQHDIETGLCQPVDKIYADPEFNCRGFFTATDVMELAKDIASKGLVEPVIIRPLWPTEQKLKDQGFEFSLVAGFRRYTSYKVNQADQIPALIRNIKTDFECRDINAVENLQRKDLTFYQEAMSIRHYWIADWTRKEVSLRINKSEGWVQHRYILLGMPDEIQQLANQDLIRSSDMVELNKFKGDELLRTAAQLRDSRKRGEGKSVLHKLKMRDKPDRKKIRSTEELAQIMDQMRAAFVDADRGQMIMLEDIMTPQGNMLIHRVLAWAAGNVSSLDVHIDIRDFCKKIGVSYEIPEFLEVP